MHEQPVVAAEAEVVVQAAEAEAEALGVVQAAEAEALGVVQAAAERAVDPRAAAPAAEQLAAEQLAGVAQPVVKAAPGQVRQVGAPVGRVERARALQGLQAKAIAVVQPRQRRVVVLVGVTADMAAVAANRV